MFWIRGTSTQEVGAAITGKSKKKQVGENAISLQLLP